MFLLQLSSVYTYRTAKSSQV